MEIKNEKIILLACDNNSSFLENQNWRWINFISLSFLDKTEEKKWEKESEEIKNKIRLYIN